jgi:hypothetical protein
MPSTQPSAQAQLPWHSSLRSEQPREPLRRSSSDGPSQKGEGSGKGPWGPGAESAPAAGPLQPPAVQRMMKVWEEEEAAAGHRSQSSSQSPSPQRSVLTDARRSGGQHVLGGLGDSLQAPSAGAEGGKQAAQAMTLQERKREQQQESVQSPDLGQLSSSVGSSDHTPPYPPGPGPVAEGREPRGQGSPGDTLGEDVEARETSSSGRVSPRRAARHQHQEGQEEEQQEEQGQRLQQQRRQPPRLDGEPDQPQRGRPGPRGWVDTGGGYDEASISAVIAELRATPVMGGSSDGRPWPDPPAPVSPARGRAPQRAASNEADGWGLLQGGPSQERQWRGKGGGESGRRRSASPGPGPGPSRGSGSWLSSRGGSLTGAASGCLAHPAAQAVQQRWEVLGADMGRAWRACTQRMERATDACAACSCCPGTACGRWQARLVAGCYSIQANRWFDIFRYWIVDGLAWLACLAGLLAGFVGPRCVASELPSSPLNFP